MLKKIYLDWKDEIFTYRRQLSLALFLALIAIILNMLSGNYVDKVGTAQPADLILDALPPIDLSILYAIIFFPAVIFIIVRPFVSRIQKIHYVIGVLSVFLVIRAGFAVLTHLMVPIDAVHPSWIPAFYDPFSFSNYLFFAGNVGVLFLGFLMYESKPVKYYLLTASILTAIIVLFMHTHYSIDVLAAYFITYGIYKFGDFIFGEEKDGKK